MAGNGRKGANDVKRRQMGGKRRVIKSTSVRACESTCERACVRAYARGRRAEEALMKKNGRERSSSQNIYTIRSVLGIRQMSKTARSRLAPRPPIHFGGTVRAFAPSRPIGNFPPFPRSFGDAMARC
eukprot:2944305-Pleurochrysis_carterae.AAC.1